LEFATVDLTFMVTDMIHETVELGMTSTADADDDVATHLLLRKEDMVVGQHPIFEVPATKSAAFHVSPQIGGSFSWSSIARCSL